MSRGLFWEKKFFLINITFVCHFRTSTKKFSDFWQTYFDKTVETAFYVSRETNFEEIITHRFLILSEKFLVFLWNKIEKVVETVFTCPEEKFEKRLFRKSLHIFLDLTCRFPTTFCPEVCQNSIFCVQMIFFRFFSSFSYFEGEFFGRIFKYTSCVSNGFLWAKLFLFLKNKKLSLIFFWENSLNQHSQCPNDLFQGNKKLS